MRLRPWTREARKQLTAGAVAAHMPSRVDSQGEEDRPQRVALLFSPGAWDGLITSSAGTAGCHGDSSSRPKERGKGSDSGQTAGRRNDARS